MRQKLADFRNANPEHRVLMGVVLGLIGQIQNPTDRDCQLVIRKMVKDNKESIAEAESKIGEETHRKDGKTYEQIAMELMLENEVLEQFLPTVMDRESVEAIVNGMEFTSMKACMEHFKTTYDGVYEGAVVADVWKKYKELNP